MLTITVLAVIAGNLMWSASARYHVTYQSASWQEALVGAEAGVDFAMAELRKRVTLDPNDVAFAPSPTGSNLAWTPSNAAGASYRDNGHAFPADNRPFAVSVHPGEGNSTMRTRVYVDVPGYGTDAASPKTNFARSLPAGVDSFMCEQSDKIPYNPENLQWYRIRALGVAGVSGPARPSPDARDNWLRRFSFVNDWRTAQPLDAGGPQVSRLVEVVAKPLTTSRHALVADRPHGSTDFAMNLREQDMVVDSYDSRRGPYNPVSNHGEKGNLAANGRVRGGGAVVIKGDAMTNQGTDILPANVSGRHRDDFFQELTPVTLDGMRPDWTGVTNLGTLDGTVASLLNPVASLDPIHPTRLKVNTIDLRGGKILNVTAPTNPLNPDAPSYVKIYVEGDLKVAADGSAIHLADGVNAHRLLHRQRGPPRSGRHQRLVERQPPAPQGHPAGRGRRRQPSPPLDLPVHDPGLSGQHLRAEPRPHPRPPSRRPHPGFGRERPGFAQRQRPDRGRPDQRGAGPREHRRQ